jgi:hypothetical protein
MKEHVYSFFRSQVIEIWDTLSLYVGKNLLTSLLHLRHKNFKYKSLGKEDHGNFHELLKCLCGINHLYIVQRK